jgi:sulfur carrier protein
MIVNGETKQCGGRGLEELLRDEGFDVRRVAVVLNGKVVKRDTFKDLVLSESDTMEVVTFVGGG